MNPKTSWLWGLCLLLVWLCCSGEVWADCFGLFRQKKFARAGQCFARQAQGMGQGQLGEAARVRKGRLLRNAALSYERAAQGVNAERAADWREQAVLCLRRVLRQGLVEDARHRRATQELLRGLQARIGYAWLTVVTGQAGALVCVRAQGWRRCERGVWWKLRVLPRLYQVEVTYPGESPRSKKCQVRANARKTVLFSSQEHRAVTVVTNDRDATLVVTGQRLSQALTARGVVWSRRLAPGRYQLKVIYPGHAPLVRSFQVVARKSTVLVLRRPGPPVLVVNTTPINAQVYVDGTYKGNSSLRLKLTPGLRRVEIRRGCYVIERREIHAQPNQDYAISLVLQRESAYLKWVKAKQEPNRLAIAGWTSLVTGVLAAGVGGVMHGLASDRHGNALDQRPVNFPGYNQLAQEGNTYRAAGYASLGVGAVGVGVGVVSLLLARPRTKFQLPCQVPIVPSNDDL